jgi:hypothetical protein
MPTLPVDGNALDAIFSQRPIEGNVPFQKI